MGMTGWEGNPREFEEIRDFKECLHSYALQELKSFGASYSWSNRHESSPRMFFQNR